MLQQRKKDYLQRLIEEFFKKLDQIVNREVVLDNSEKEVLINECFGFFYENLQAEKSDELKVLVEKISDNDLLEQYAKLLMTEYDFFENTDQEGLLKSLSIIEYLESTDKTFSWERTVLKEDILRRLDDKS
ncbi:MAG: hypothetical protein ACK5M3_16925 [Dysgonomonas sp.]